MQRVLGFEGLEKRTPPASLFGALGNFFSDESGLHLRRALRSLGDDDSGDRASAVVHARRWIASLRSSDAQDDDGLRYRRWHHHRHDHDEIKQRTNVNELFVENFPNDLENVIGNRTGRAKLERSDDEIELTLRTRGLTPGHAYTVWWVVFNNPSECEDGCFLDEITAAQEAAENGTTPPAAEVSVLYATSGIANHRGKAVFRAELSENEAPGQVLFGPTLTSAEGAEIHAVVRTHGPASDDPQVLQEQLTTFNGGCPPNTCTDIQVGVFRSPQAS